MRNRLRRSGNPVRTTRDAARLRVLMLPAAVRGGDNPFVEMLCTALRDTGSIDVEQFAWRAALRERVDLVHVHWPERLVRASSRREEWENLLKLTLLVLRSRLGGPALVQTVHNLAPHEGGGLPERIALLLWRRAVEASVFMSTPEDMAGRRPLALIPHGDYQPFVDGLRSSSTRARTGLLLFGYLRPYKDIELLIESVQQLPTERLTVSGFAKDPAYGALLTELAGSGPGTAVRVERLDDQVLVDLIRSSEIVVLPYREMYNSGAAVLALTLHVPVVLTESSATRSLQDEVGSEWVAILPRRWGSKELAAAIADLRESADRRSAPALGPERAWPTVARSYLDVYRSLRSRGRGIEGLAARGVRDVNESRRSGWHRRRGQEQMR